MKLLNIIFASFVLLSNIVTTYSYQYVYSISVDRDSEPDFCKSNGYLISKEKYSYEFAEVVCASIGKQLAMSNDDNFNIIGFAFSMCHSEETEAWYSGHIENVFDECMIYNAESYSCGSVFTTTECEKKLPIICN